MTDKLRNLRKKWIKEGYSAGKMRKLTGRYILNFEPIKQLFNNNPNDTELIQVQNAIIEHFELYNKTPTMDAYCKKYGIKR